MYENDLALHMLKVLSVSIISQRKTTIQLEKVQRVIVLKWQSW